MADDAYDRIAALYDVDMARNMPFDDVGFYASVAAQARGRSLEIGCGNGRILLPMLRQGLDAWGADRSRGMLKELARKSSRWPLRAAQMDGRALGFASGVFDVVLCPYSLVTYCVGDDDVAALLGEARRVLRPRGRLVVDAFVPRPAVVSDEFRRDYERAFGDGTLVRSKRVAVVAPGVHRIERRYEIRHGDDAERIETIETIRCFGPAALSAAVTAAGFDVERRVADYGAGRRVEDAQFCTIVARRRQS